MPTSYDELHITVWRLENVTRTYTDVMVSNKWVKFQF